MLDQQAGAISDLSSRVNVAYDRVQKIETKPPAMAQLKPPTPQPVQAAAPVPEADEPIPNFSVPPAGHIAPPARGQVPTPAERHAAEQMAGEPQRGWFGLAKRFVRPGENPETPTPEDRAGGAAAWDMKSLLAAAEHEKPQATHTRRIDPNLDRAATAVQPQQPRHPAPSAPQTPPRAAQHADAQRVRPGNGQRAPQRPSEPATPVRGPAPAATPAGHTSSRHMIETLQAMAIDLDRFLEDDPPLDLLRRYRNGERNVFARRLVSILGRDQAERIGRKYREDGEFRETVDNYVRQFETLMEQTARSDRESVLVETYLTSQTGKVYVALASAIGRLA